MDTDDIPRPRTAQIVSLEEFRARRTLKAFQSRVGQLRQSVADMRGAMDDEPPLLAFRRDPPA